MAKELKDLTKRSVDYSRWYNELVVKADLAEQSPVRGCMVIKPYGYAIWEKMKAFSKILMLVSKQPGCKMLISLSLSPRAISPKKLNTLSDLPRNVLS